jgi:uncharacterized protein with von Willebrand factor type A (vWA) domain
VSAGSSVTLFAAREARLAALDALPRRLWLGGLTNCEGSVEARLGMLRGLRESLQAGSLPDPSCAAWPEPALRTRVFEVAAELELPRLCREHTDLADPLLGSLLWHLDRIADYIDHGESREAAISSALDAFADDWRERGEIVKELVEVLGEAGDLFKNTNWDALRGLLKSAGWQEILRIHRRLACLPELVALIRRLGRTQPVDADQAASDVEAPTRASVIVPATHTRVTHLPEVPGETRGVFRSGRIARMLPSETLQLRHPRLRLVWHARHVERSLLTYEEDDRIEEIMHTPLPATASSTVRRPAPRLECGPILVCVDTSGSMLGGAEIVAKAVVLEAMRTASAQRRGCRVYAFGGPDEIVELELAATLEGIERLARFLEQGFHGGTDVIGPLERVLVRLSEESWQRADLLIASDGEFGATKACADAVDRAKRELGLRVQGVLIGDRETIGLLELADDIFWVRDWRRHGGARVDSPVPSKSLTAMFFPGALRGPGAGAPQSGAAAASAVAAGRRQAP